MEGDSEERGEGRECENGVEEGREWRVWWEERRNGESGEGERSEYCTVLHIYRVYIHAQRAMLLELTWEGL